MTVNELYPELLATASLSFDPACTSSSRIQMFATHLTQMLVMRGATPRRVFTGTEREFGKYTFKVKMPADAVIIDVVPKYQETIGRNAITSNPLVVVVYMDVETREIGIVEVPKYHLTHQYFGFRYNFKRSMSQLHKGATIRKGTVLADSPNIDENNDYMFGIEANVCAMTIPGVIEDGVVISKSLAKRMTTVGYDHLTGNWGKRFYPLNLYGDDLTYKPFPDIGEHVRPDGLLMAFREFDELTDPIYMTPKALQTLDIRDRRVYTKANAKVVDVQTRFDPKGPSPETPAGMDEQVRRYHNAETAFYSHLIQIHERLTREAQSKKETLRISRPFHRLLSEAIQYMLDPSRVRCTRIVQRQPLDEWRADITVEYELEPTNAFKLTGTHGDKGVICQVWDDQRLPVDKHGTRADMIIDGNTTLNRVNSPRLNEIFLNATSDQVERNIRAMIAGDRPTDAEVEKCFAYVKRYYEIVSSDMATAVNSSAYKNGARGHIENILKNKHSIRLMIKTNNQRDIVDVIRQLEQEYPIDKGPVRYVGASGQVRETVEPMIIASQYIMLLEKTGSDWTAVASGTLQQHGILAKLTRHDKNAHGGRTGSVRVMGEDEIRLTGAITYNNTTGAYLKASRGPTAADGLAGAELADMGNNPIVHMEMVRNLLKAPQPTNVDCLVDRSKFPLGKSRSLTRVMHDTEISGITMYEYDDLTDSPDIYDVSGLLDDGPTGIEVDDEDTDE